MKVNFIFFISYFISLFSLYNSKLIFVMTHFRHGARAPSTKGNKDQVGEEWNLASGQLTGVGERQQYLLGFRNRIRYVTEEKLLSEKYDPSEFLIITSDYDRTIISLLSHLQGLYPQSSEQGKNLTTGQIEHSDPPVDISKTEIQTEKTNLNSYSLPHLMTLMSFEQKSIMNINSCGMNIQNMKDIINNIQLTEGLNNLVDEFNEKYKSYIYTFRGSDSTANFTFAEIFQLIESFISSYVDGREMTKLASTGLNFEEFYNYALRIGAAFSTEGMYRNNETLYIRGTYYMELFLNYTKIMIDLDNNRLSSTETKFPKMVIISGHEMTVCFQELFIQYAYNKNYDELFRFPNFASQIALEVRRNDDEKTNRDYSDYYVTYYFDDEVLLNVTLDEFINTIEPHIWSDDEINSFCSVISDDNDRCTDNKSNKKTYKTLFIIFTCLFGVSLIIIAIFVYIIKKQKNLKQIHSQEMIEQNKLNEIKSQIMIEQQKLDQIKSQYSNFEKIKNENNVPQKILEQKKLEEIKLQTTDEQQKLDSN